MSFWAVLRALLVLAAAGCAVVGLFYVLLAFATM